MTNPMFQVDLDLHPESNPDLRLQAMTYAVSREMSASLSETVYFSAKVRGLRFDADLTPDEARQLAGHLTEVADAATAARARRESFDQICEDLRDADIPPACFYAHPDVHYVPEDRVQQRMAELEASGAARFIVMSSDEVLA